MRPSSASGWVLSAFLLLCAWHLTSSLALQQADQQSVPPGPFKEVELAKILDRLPPIHTNMDYGASPPPSAGVNNGLHGKEATGEFDPSSFLGLGMGEAAKHGSKFGANHVGIHVAGADHRHAGEDAYSLVPSFSTKYHHTVDHHYHHAPKGGGHNLDDSGSIPLAHKEKEIRVHTHKLVGFQ